MLVVVTIFLLSAGPTPCPVLCQLWRQAVKQHRSTIYKMCGSLWPFSTHISLNTSQRTGSPSSYILVSLVSKCSMNQFPL